MTATRPDIQALRGIAVLAVLAYHAKVPFFKGGYLGVDIFFVVSGYLITGLIARGINEGRFSFAQFYWRRAWRLLPAAYVVFFACAVASPWLLTAGEQRDFIKQLVGAVTFTGNIALWLQIGYFEQAAELKPLLHVWSLAIEEQYYLLLPIAMLWIAPRRWRTAAVVVTLISLIACFVQMPSMPGAVFYLLPTRAWELGVGSVVALSAHAFAKPGPAALARRALSTASLVGLGVLIVAPGQTVHPGWATALACAFTAVIAANELSWLGLRFGTSLLAWFGDRSYSLYLVHWPLFAFLNSANVGGGGLPWQLRLSGVFVAIVTAAALYYLVESPLRVVGRHNVKPKFVAYLLVAPVAIVVCGFAASLVNHDSADFGHRLRPNVGLDLVCDHGATAVAAAKCASGTRPPVVLVWGDSFAMHWVHGLASSGLSVVQATKSACPPLLDLSLDSLPKQSATWPAECIAFNDSVLDSIRARAIGKVDVVVLSSAWQYLLGARAVNRRGELFVASREVIEERLIQGVNRLVGDGVPVVILGPPPSVGYDIGRCIERRRMHLLYFGAPSDCSISLSTYRARNVEVDAILRAPSMQSGVTLLLPEHTMCDARTDRCIVETNEAILYRDTGHLSYEGSGELVRRMNLAETIRLIAQQR